MKRGRGLVLFLVTKKNLVIVLGLFIEKMR